MDFPKKGGNEPIFLRSRSCRSREEEEQPFGMKVAGVFFLGNGDLGSGAGTRPWDPAPFWGREKPELVKMG